MPVASKTSSSLLPSLLLLSFLLGCGSSGSAPRNVVVSEPEVPDETALLVLMSDRRLFEPVVVRSALQGDALLRRELALTLGRVGSPFGSDILRELLDDSSAEVRRAAAASAGWLGDPGLEPTLLRLAGGTDGDVGSEAVRSLARLETPLRRVLAGLGDLDEAEIWPRILPHLYAFAPNDRAGLEQLGLEQPPGLARWAAYSLARSGRPDSRPELVALLESPDPWLRSLACRALGEVGTGEDLARLRGLLLDRDPMVVEEALAAGRRLVQSGRSAPPAAWREQLLALAEQSLPAVRVAALEAAGAWLLDEDLGRLLVARAADEDPTRRREREVALVALASAREPRTAGLVATAVRSPEASVRAHAAYAAGHIGQRSVLEELRQDPHPLVRVAVVMSEIGSPALAGEALRARLREALGDPAPLVRRAALAFLVERPLLEADEIYEGLAQGVLFVEVRVALAEALLSRARRHDSERQAVIGRLGELVEDGQYPVRRAAARALEELGEPAPPTTPVRTGRSASVYADLVRRSSLPWRLRFELLTGGVEVELDCSTARLSCVSLLQLAGQGYFDGLPLYRVASDLIRGGLDDRGQGPGYLVRDEPSSLSFDRPGVLGLLRSVPDSTSSAFVITLAPQPHLDAEATPVGLVTEGLEHLQGVVDGDRLVAVREVLK